MTAPAAQAQRLPPRGLVRIFWVLHRAAYRLAGARFGLWRPKAGGRFGTMRLTTIGRRSGRPRVAMVGHFEDGPNLVTLAMNGWAEAEPAWWLNLQAQPETTVDLPDGSRAVQARAVVGEERALLWAHYRDYHGWGDDLDALAAPIDGEGGGRARASRHRSGHRVAITERRITSRNGERRVP